MTQKQKVFGWLVGVLIAGVGSLYIAYLFRDIIRETVELQFLTTTLSEDIKPEDCPVYIAHGGGIVHGIGRTNSLDALEETYQRGFRYFELDGNWTSDGELALIHDWNQSIRDLFSMSPAVLTKADFLSAKMILNMRQMMIADAIEWIEQRVDAFIVTDIKDNNITGLSLIADEYPDALDQIIPQVYRFGEIEKVRELGYRQVILTLYRSRYTDAGILEFCKKQKPFAITMPYDRALSSLPQKLAEINVMTYVHGVHSHQKMNELFDHGVRGIYTSDLLPLENPNMGNTK